MRISYYVIRKAGTDRYYVHNRADNVHWVSINEQPERFDEEKFAHGLMRMYAQFFRGVPCVVEKMYHLI